jgi:hypothetical protein
MMTTQWFANSPRGFSNEITSQPTAQRARRLMMEPADFTSTTYYWTADGTRRVLAPDHDEPTEDYEAIQTVSTCTADGSIVNIADNGQQARCLHGGHRWRYVGGSVEEPGAWRQVS